MLCPKVNSISLIGGVVNLQASHWFARFDSLQSRLVDSQLAHGCRLDDPLSLIFRSKLTFGNFVTQNSVQRFKRAGSFSSSQGACSAVESVGPDPIHAVYARTLRPHAENASWPESRGAISSPTKSCTACNSSAMSGLSCMIDPRH